MADLAQRQDLAESAVNERDLGKHNNATTGFKALAKQAGKEYGSKAAGERVAGAQFQKMKRAGKLEEGHCSTCDHTPCTCNEGNAFSKAVVDAKRDGIQPGEKIRVGGKTYPVKEADPMGMAEGAFKNMDIDRQKREERKKQQRGLGQVPGVQDLKPGTKEHPLKNVAKGIKAFVQGKPEPMDEEKEPRSKGTAFDPETRKQMKTDREGTGNFDKKKTSTGTVYTRRHKEDDEEETQVKSDQPKKKGRPKGPAKGPERVTAKSYKYKNGRPVKENEISIVNRGEYDQEGNEVKGDMHTVIRHAQELEQHLKNGENVPTWVIEKVGQIKGMMTSICDYMLSQHERGAEQATGREGIRIAEKAVSQKQQKFMGMAHAMQQGEKIKGASPALKKVARTMKPKDVEDFAATKRKGLPTKVKEAGKPDFLDLDKDGNKTEPMKQAAKQAKGKKREVEETTTAGSVATVSTSAPKGKSGMTFGKGVYEAAVNESYERKLSKVLNEGMNITVNMDAEGQKSIGVIADGDDAEKLAEILKLAGLGGESSGCSSCGTSPCGCSEQVDENQPDWPTNTVTDDADDPYLRRLSGGLNDPKSTGQTTIPVISGQDRRMSTRSTMEENVKLERDLFKLYKNYKPQ